MRVVTEVNLSNGKVTHDEVQAAAITGAASTIATDDLTSGRALISDSHGKVAVSSTTSTELYHLHGVTSNVQAQLNGKVNASSVEITTANGYIYVLFSVDNDNKLQVRANATTQAVRTKLSGTWSSWRTI